MITMDKLQQEFLRSQEASHVVRRPTFEHAASSTSLGLQDDSSPSPSYLASPPAAALRDRPPPFVSHASHASSSSRSDAPPYHQSSYEGNPNEKDAADWLPAMYQDLTGAAPLPDLYSSTSHLSSSVDYHSSDGGTHRDTWGERGQWNDGLRAEEGAGPYRAQLSPSRGPSAWPSSLPRPNDAHPDTVDAYRSRRPCDGPLYREGTRAGEVERKEGTTAAWQSHYLDLEPRQHSGLDRSTSFAGSGTLSKPHADLVEMSPEFGLVRSTSRRGTFRTMMASLVPPSIPTRLYLGLVLLQSLIVLAMLVLLTLHYYALEGTDFKFTEADAEEKRLPVWLGIFALAHAWLFGMAVEGLRARNVIQIICLSFFNVALLTYSIIQISEIRGVFDLSSDYDDSDATGLQAIPVDVLSALIPATIGVGQVGYVVLDWFIYREFGWETYKALGADRSLKRCLGKFNVFACLCKFDVFFFLGFSIQLVYLVLGKDWEYYLTMVALPFSLALLALGWFSARRELRVGMYAFIVGLVAGGTYFSWKTYRIWTNQDVLQTIVKSLTVFSALSLALLLATLCMTIVVLRNFGKGLKEGLDRKRAADKKEKSSTGVGFNGGRSPLERNPSQRRMSIE